MSTNKIVFKELHVEHICNPKLKHCYISVKKDAKILLKTPRVSKLYIQELLLEKERWIRKQLTYIYKNPSIEPNTQDELLLFGEIISIDSEAAEELRRYLHKIDTSDSKKVAISYDKFYMYAAHKYVTPRVGHFSEIMGLRFGDIRYKKMRSRWGSCKSNGTLTFNTQLLKIDKKLIDYIIVHELAHLKHMNHSKEFHSLVSLYVPNWRELNQELKHFRLS